jgi:ATP-dependent Lhr-like helicase
MPLSVFHPAVARWFRSDLGMPTPVQAQAWPAIRSGAHALLAAPTGSGKTLAAFLAAIDALVQEGLATGLPDETRVLYVSPLKALSNDIEKNLRRPLAAIRGNLLDDGLPQPDIRVWVRTGDTPSSERTRMTKTPPHIVVTTPESLYLMLTSAGGRHMLATVRTVIVDEIHALAGNKRGAHLSLSLERLATLCGRRLTRIGLSATQEPIELMARFLVGDRDEPCRIVDTGHARRRDLALELIGSPLETIMSNETFEEIYDRLAELIRAHRTTLVFVNTRRLCERATRHLAERLGEEAVTAHHGSLARERRLDAEQRLKAGRLRALVATSSLELGIDIGEVDLVCQLASPRGIAAFLQRVGRSGHGVMALPKGRLFPLSRDDLVECAVLLGCAQRGELDRICVPQAPMDVLAQQIVAEVAAREWDTSALYASFRYAWPYRELDQARFDGIVRMLAQGFTTRRGRRGAHLHHDAVNRRLRPRAGARMFAIMNGGAIPDQFDYDVVLAPENMRIGTIGEDFAFESMPGDVFQLGNASYRVLKVETSKVYVEDAHGAAPNLPFWVGEAPGRTDELSRAVSALRESMETELERGVASAIEWTRATLGVQDEAASQIVEYLGAARAALGVLPTHEHLVIERFFDEAGDTHVVLHSPYGARVNRAFGLALRKRFCRKFNFELQAAALEDSLVLSLGPTHSFPLAEVARYLHSHSVRELLVQALLDAPMFPVRWRWNATISLAVRRNRNGKRVPPQIQRSDAEDLVALVFPDQLACAENLAGAREIPDHPLVQQTLHDCLHEVMDIDGLERLLARIESGEVTIVAREVAAPSPLAHAVLSARPYAFLDDTPAEERRTRAIQIRRFMGVEEAAQLGHLDPAAVARVRDQAWPVVRNADELHDALSLLGFIVESEAAPEWHALLDALIAERRASRVATPASTLWVAAERCDELKTATPGVAVCSFDGAADVEVASSAALTTVAPSAGNVELRHRTSPATATPGVAVSALVEILRSRLEGLGPVTAQQLGAPLGIDALSIDTALLMLEAEGFVLRGSFTNTETTEWCERRLLARIHSETLHRLRKDVEPVNAADYVRFLAEWHGLAERGSGEAALVAALERLEGFAAPAAAWEASILPQRVADFEPQMLDRLCAAGRVVWLRLGARGEARAPVRHTPVVFVPRSAARMWRAFAPRIEDEQLSEGARTVRNTLRAEGALFHDDLLDATALSPEDLRAALAELVAGGLVHADTFAGLRVLITPQRAHPRRRRIEDAGRWVLLRGAGEGGNGAVGGRAFRPASSNPDPDAVEHVARALLRRYGVVFHKVLEREVALPPWRELLRVYWRLEARGELRGGRFIEGFSGEQFALPEAVGLLREVRRHPRSGPPVRIAAGDPLNLTGIVLPGERIPARLGAEVEMGACFVGSGPPLVAAAIGD